MEYPETSSGVPTEGRNLSDNTPPPTPAPHLAQVEVDDSTTTSNYANFCRLSGTPEELLIDFGLSLAAHISDTTTGCGVAADCYRLAHSQAVATRPATDGRTSRSCVWCFGDRRAEAHWAQVSQQTNRSVHHDGIRRSVNADNSKGKQLT